MIPCSTDHIFRMTDDTGMFQHAIDGVPDPNEGYTTDDNARALIMASLLYERERKPAYAALLYRYAAFLCYAQNKNGTFRNFMGYNRDFLEEMGSEDCFGRCLWAICYTLSRESTPRAIRNMLQMQLARAIPHCQSLRFLRAGAYAAVALSFLGKGSPYQDELCKLSTLLADAYRSHQVESWQWFENEMTYCNFVLPRAMMRVARILNVAEWQEIGLESLGFLESKTTEHGHFHAIGCHGWLKKGGKPARYDEQPVEPCGGVLAYLTAYKMTGDASYLEKARTCFSWYLGNNAQKVCMVDLDTGGCYDGTNGDQINRNQGAESLVSYWIAYLKLQNYLSQ
ncbi:MAG: glycosyltransferase [Ethanoligenens sp.]